MSYYLQRSGKAEIGEHVTDGDVRFLGQIGNSVFDRYADVSEITETGERAGVSRKHIKLTPTGEVPEYAKKKLEKIISNRKASLERLVAEYRDKYGEGDAPNRKHLPPTEHI